MTYRHPNTTHGHTTTENFCGTSTYRIWSAMLSRCRNKKNAHYKDYGGRGIIVCERWANFENFLADMGERPSKELTLDRIDNDGNYEPGNCQWATWFQQAANRRSRWNRFRGLEINGKILTIGEAAKRFGINPSTIKSRIRYGWSDLEVVTTPILPHVTPQLRPKSDDGTFLPYREVIK